MFKNINLKKKEVFFFKFYFFLKESIHLKIKCLKVEIRIVKNAKIILYLVWNYYIIYVWSSFKIFKNLIKIIKCKENVSILI